MSYEINRFNGAPFASVADQTVDSTSSPLKFIGKNYAGYGEVQNENFLHLLENFRGLAEPTRSIVGQLWYDENTNKIKYRDLSERYRALTVTEFSDTAPTGLLERDKGNLWYNSSVGQLYVWDGAAFVLVGPEIADTFGKTKLESGTIIDNGQTRRPIIRVFVNDVVVGVISSAEFQIGVIESIPGFTVIKKGLTLVNTPSTGITTNDFVVWGTASNSRFLNGLTENDFVRRGVNGSTFDDAGFSLGNDNDLKFFVENTNKPIISNELGNSITLRIKDGTSNRNVVVVNSTNVIPGETQVYNLGEETNKWNEVYALRVNANLTGNVTGNVTGDVTGTLFGTHRGNIVNDDASIAYNSNTKTFTANSFNGTFNGTLNGDLRGNHFGDLYSESDDLAFDADNKIFFGSLEGNATTASRLQEPKYINNALFDGSSNITVFDTTKVSKSGDTMTGYLTLSGDPVQPLHAATKFYVDEYVKNFYKNKALVFSLDVKGLNLTGGNSPGTVVHLLNSLAPPANYEFGQEARITTTIQNVTATGSLIYTQSIGRFVLSGISVSPTVQDPSRIYALVYRVNASRTSWEYVSGA